MQLAKTLKIAGLTVALASASALAQAVSLNQAAWVPNTNTYQFGYNSIANIPLSGAPSDTDYNRSAMLHDGTSYRLYYFKQGTNDTLYQFSWDGATYQYGYNSATPLKIVNAPSDASSGDIAMLHDGSTYRLYMLSNDQSKVYQFGWDGSVYRYGYNSIPSISITGAPSDTDKSRWSMLHDGSKYRMYFGKGGTSDKIYQFVFNGSTYQYGYGSAIPELTLESIPEGSNNGEMNMLHDGSDFRLYLLAY